MNIRRLIFASAVASAPFFPGSATAQGAAQPTLWGIYGAHDKHDCPVNNRETAKDVIALSLSDLGPLMEKYGVTAVVDQYHSGLEHTFLWVVETTEPHNLEEFAIELGVARWNDLKFVPERTFGDVIRDVRSIHGLENWQPSGGS
ncbi:MAG: hypothetical protein ABFS14_10570 [Gemmatimonadota bacterium]